MYEEFIQAEQSLRDVAADMGHDIKLLNWTSGGWPDQTINTYECLYCSITVTISRYGRGLWSVTASGLDAPCKYNKPVLSATDKAIVQAIKEYRQAPEYQTAKRVERAYINANQIEASVLWYWLAEEHSGNTTL